MNSARVRYLALVLVVLLIFFQFRLAFWVSLGLPVALLATFMLMPLFGLDINNLTLYAMILMLGMLVDDAIIFASQEGKIFSLDTGSNTVKQLANLETEINSALCVFDGIIYIHTQDTVLHRVDLNTGAKLTEISLEKEED